MSASAEILSPELQRLAVLIATALVIYMQTRAAKKADEVKNTLKTVTEEQNRKLDQQDVKMDVIYHQGNGLRGQALRTIALAKRVIATHDPSPRNVAEAEQAEHEADRHELEQDNVSKAIEMRIAQAKFAPDEPPAKRAPAPVPVSVIESQPFPKTDAPVTKP